jgi:hypothetical protein
METGCRMLLAATDMDNAAKMRRQQESSSRPRSGALQSISFLVAGTLQFWSAQIGKTVCGTFGCSHGSVCVSDICSAPPVLVAITMASSVLEQFLRSNAIRFSVRGSNMERGTSLRSFRAVLSIHLLSPVRIFNAGRDFTFSDPLLFRVRISVFIWLE